MEEIEPLFDSLHLSSPLSIERSLIIKEGNILFNESIHSKGAKEKGNVVEEGCSWRNIRDNCAYRRYDGDDKGMRGVAEASENRFLRNTEEEEEEEENAQTHESISRPDWDR